jgi:hypothetical protein
LGDFSPEGWRGDWRTKFAMFAVTAVAGVASALSIVDDATRAKAEFAVFGAAAPVGPNRYRSPS